MVADACGDGMSNHNEAGSPVTCSGEEVTGNEEYVLNHSGEQETTGTVDILRNGFTTNQKRMIERMRGLMQDAGFARRNEPEAD